MDDLITVYRRAWDRKSVELFTMDTFLFKPEVIAEKFGDRNINVTIGHIKRTKDKEYRNFKKRDELPIAELFDAGYLAIDIDDLYGDQKEIDRLVKLFEADPNCYAVKGTPSGNLVAFYKFDCSEEDFPKLYYKLYLELTLKLSCNIDYLPDARRLRYLSNGEIYHYNEQSGIVTEMMEMDEVPIIKKVKPKTEEIEVTEGGTKIRRTKRIYLAGSFNHD
tara:strand:- start:494 stop:1153 length:660 start_codon:yes stop_codon:yes gene_type:complete